MHLLNTKSDNILVASVLLDFLQLFLCFSAPRPRILQPEEGFSVDVTMAQ